MPGVKEPIQQIVLSSNAQVIREFRRWRSSESRSLGNSLVLGPFPVPIWPQKKRRVRRCHAAARELISRSGSSHFVRRSREPRPVGSLEGRGRGFVKGAISVAMDVSGAERCHPFCLIQIVMGFRFAVTVEAERALLGRQFPVRAAAP